MGPKREHLQLWTEHTQPVDEGDFGWAHCYLGPENLQLDILRGYIFNNANQLIWVIDCIYAYNNQASIEKRTIKKKILICEWLLAEL